MPDEDVVAIGNLQSSIGDDDIFYVGVDGTTDGTVKGSVLKSAVSGNQLSVFTKFESTAPTATGTVSTSTSNLFDFSTTDRDAIGITIDDTNQRFPVVAGRRYELEASVCKLQCVVRAYGYALA